MPAKLPARGSGGLLGPCMARAITPRETLSALWTAGNARDVYRGAVRPASRRDPNLETHGGEPRSEHRIAGQIPRATHHTYKHTYLETSGRGGVLADRRVATTLGWVVETVLCSAAVACVRTAPTTAT